MLFIVLAILVIGVLIARPPRWRFARSWQVRTVLGVVAMFLLVVLVTAAIPGSFGFHQVAPTLHNIRR
jgi:low affinity Fe/Cu permease